MHPSSRHYLRFCVGDSVLQFHALCFGLSTAPQVFTRVMASISSVMHRYGFRILCYLDDWLVLGSSFRDIMRARDFLLWLCREHGICANLAKSSLDPSQTLDYLGMRLQTHPLRVFPTPKRVQKLSSLLHEFVSCQQQPLSLASAPRSDVLSVDDRSGISSVDEVSSAAPQRLRSASSRFRLGVLGRVLLCRSSVVVRRAPSARRYTARPSTSRTRPLHRRLGYGLGCLSH